MNSTFKWKSSFSEDIFKQKYQMNKEETWPERCRIIVNDVCGDRTLTAKPDSYNLMSKTDRDELTQMMVDQKFIPGGRYVYYAGRPAGFFNNCFAGDTKLLTPNGMETFKSLAGQEIHVYSPISKQFEPAIMYEHGYQKLNKITFVPVRGTSRIKWSVRATRTHRWPLIDGTDTYDIRVGDVVPAALVELDVLPHAYIHGLFFADGGYSGNNKRFKMRLCGRKKEWLQYILDHSKNSKVTYPDSANGEPYIYVSSDVDLKVLPSTNDPEYIASFIRGWASFDGHHGECRRINSINEEAIDMFIEYAHLAGYIVTGTKSYTDKPSNFGERINKLFHVQFIYAQDFSGFKVESVTPDGEERVYCPREPKHERIVINYGIDTYQCFCLKAEEDTREEWAAIAQRATSALMSGGGIGVDYSTLRPSGRTLSRTGGISSGPIPLMHIVNEIGRNVMQGGSRRSAIFASLNWQHEDIRDFITAKNWSEDIRRMKSVDYNFPAPMDMTNISVNWDTAFIEAVKGIGNPPDSLWYEVVTQMCKTGEPGMCFNFYENEKETLRNACTEFTSEDDSDVCNLGSINLGNIETLDELREVVGLAAKFLVCGTIRGEVPYEKVKDVRDRNRKIGLGLMGIHEWLLRRNYPYEVVPELKDWLEVYKVESERAANEHCDRFYLSHPKKYRAIAPAGTLSILASTSSGIEPLFAVAYKRRYLVDGTKWKYQYVIDSTAKRLIDELGVHPDRIESSYSLAAKPEQRIRFQSDIQDYVDMGISSTINLPEWGTELNNEDTTRTLADTILRYCTRLRGLTTFPSGSRGLQPLVEVPYEEAVKNEGIVFAEESTCSGGVCGI